MIFRPSFVFGPDGGTLKIFMRLVRLSPVVPILGTRKLQPVWADDVGAFFGKAVTEPAAANRTFDLAGADVVTQDELFAAIKRAHREASADLPRPDRAGAGAAVVAERVPVGPPLTRDTLTMLEFEDNVATPVRRSRRSAIQPLGLDEQLRLRSRFQIKAGPRRAPPKQSVTRLRFVGATTPLRWLRRFPVGLRGHAPTSEYLHCPFCRFPRSDHLLSVVIQ